MSVKVSRVTHPGAGLAAQGPMFAPLFGLLDGGSRARMRLTVLLAVLQAMLEAAALLAMKAFLTGVSQPELVPGWTLNELAAVCVATVAASNLVSALSLSFTTKFIWSLEVKLSARLLRTYLAIPYAAYTRERVAEMSKNVLAPHLADRVLIPLSRVVTKSALTLAIMLTLLAIDPGMALQVALAFSGAYWVLNLGLRRYSRTWARKADEAATRRVEDANWVFAGFKTIRLAGAEDYFVERYRASCRLACERQATHYVLSDAPRFPLETVALGGIVALALHLSHRPGSALPMIGLYSMAAYRVLPALHFAVHNLAVFRFHLPIVEKYAAVLTDQSSQSMAPIPVTFERDIVCQDLTFAYDSRPVLSNISFRLPKGTWMGIAGRTGTGKSTLADLIVGLLSPTGGRVLIDGVELEGARVAGWQRLVGYVPQEVVLLDDTILRNITFGADPSTVRMGEVESAARSAQIHEWIVDRLPQGYATRVGERGVMLSGGQRQRLGLARALLGKPQVLILDEATNALDASTERSALQALRALRPGPTVVFITHRLESLALCDTVMHLEAGHLTRLEQGMHGGEQKSERECHIPDSP